MSRPAASGWLAAIGPAIVVALIAGIAGDFGAGWTVLLAAMAIAVGTMARVFLLPDSALSDVDSRPSRPPDRAVERPSVDLLEAVLGTMIDGVVVANSQLNLLYVNRAARTLLDIGDRPVVGRLFSEVSRSAQLYEVIETTLRTRSHQRLELQLPRLKLTVAVSAAPLDLGPSGGILVVLHDVTELRRLERMRRDFVSNVSHELKTPLTGISAYADTLLSGGLEDESRRQEFVERIQEQAERLRTLILDLLRLARIEADDVQLEIMSVDVGEVIAECVEDRAEVAAAKGVALEMKAPPETVIATAEPEGLRTILSNLIENAINYTPGGGRVEVSWRLKDGMAEIVVLDTGVGIPREHQSRVFERFYRVDRARSRALGGTGLGLSIVKHLVQAFGGSVELESEQGQGCRFIVTLPCGRPEDPSAGIPHRSDS